MAFGGKAALLPRGYGAWAYKSEDSIATVSAANYFLGAYDALEIGDRILVTCVMGLDTPAETYVAHDNLVVIADSSTTVLTSSTLVFIYAHNAVRFEGPSVDILSKAGRPAGTTDITAATLAFKVRWPVLPAGLSIIMKIEPQTIFAAPLFQLYYQGGNIHVNAVASDFTWGVGSADVSPTIVANTWYTVHVHMSSAYGAIGEIRGTCNGVAFAATGFNDNSGVWDIGTGLVTAHRMIASLTTVDVAFIYFDDSLDTNTAHFWDAGGDVDLGDDGTLSGAAAPRFFFGGRQKANDRAGDAAKGWNDGFNQGTNGAYVMTVGAVSDVT